MQQWYTKGHFGFVRASLIELRNFASTVEDLLKKESTDVNKQLLNEMQNSKSELDVPDYHAELTWELSIVFPNLLRSAVFISCYSFLEYELFDVCNKFKSEKNLHRAPNDLMGNGISLAQAYLKKVVRFDFPDQTDEWREIKAYNAIRNMIIHNNGSLSKNKKKAVMIRKYSDKTKLLTIDEKNRFEISSEFVYRAIETIERFLEKIYSATPF